MSSLLPQPPLDFIPPLSHCRVSIRIMNTNFPLMLVCGLNLHHVEARRIVEMSARFSPPPLLFSHYFSLYNEDKSNLLKLLPLLFCLWLILKEIRGGGEGGRELNSHRNKQYLYYFQRVLEWKWTWHCLLPGKRLWG